MATPLQDLAEQIELGKLRVQVGKTFRIEDVADAHRCMDGNEAGGKIVLLM